MGGLVWAVHNFFLEPGPKLQKSLCGLYRALLWQILNDDRTLVRKAFPKWQTSFNTTEPTLGALTAALDLLIGARVLRNKYLMLIDGLDEYEDEEGNTSASQEKLSKDLLQMTENGFVKIVIASRPERVFESLFSHGQRLAVHDLTVRDHEVYARDRLINDKTIRPSSERLTGLESKKLEDFVEAVARRSQGVFLWTRIVVELARNHVREHHDVDRSEDILETLPPDLEELFDQIMFKILNLREPEKVESLRYLALTSHWFAAVASRDAYSSESSPSWLPISVLGVGCELPGEKVTRSWLENNTPRLAKVGRNESRTEGRIKSYCFGLLETSDTGVATPGTRKAIKPLHRTLVEYLSRHTAIQRAQNLSLVGDGSFEANTAILLGLVVLKDCAYPFATLRMLGLWSEPTLITLVLDFNKLAEESTGNAQIAMLCRFLIAL